MHASRDKLKLSRQSKSGEIPIYLRLYRNDTAFVYPTGHTVAGYPYGIGCFGIANPQAVQVADVRNVLFGRGGEAGLYQ